MRHQTISFIKSAVRIIGYALLIESIWLAAAVLVASEFIGIWEEVGHE